MSVAAVANASGVNLNAAASSLAVPFVASSGQLIAVFVGIQSQTDTVASVTDSFGNTYTKKAAVVADYANLYPQGIINESPFYDYYVDSEVWTAASGGAVTTVTVTLSSGARFAVEIESYTGSAFGAGASATAVQSEAPSITFTTTAGNSFVAAGFASVLDPNQAASAGTLRGQVEASTRESGIEVAVADNTVASAGACTVTLVPTTLKTKLGGATEPMPATYAIVCVEVKA